jgi:hypothetical protein
MELKYSLFSLINSTEFDESESTGITGNFIGRDKDINNFATRAEQLFQVLRSYGIGEIPYIEFVGHDRFSINMIVI